MPPNPKRPRSWTPLPTPRGLWSGTELKPPPPPVGLSKQHSVVVSLLLWLSH